MLRKKSPEMDSQLLMDNAHGADVKSDRLVQNYIYALHATPLETQIIWHNRLLHNLHSSDELKKLLKEHLTEADKDKIVQLHKKTKKIHSNNAADFFNLVEEVSARISYKKG